MTTRIAILGHVGNGNLGDEAIIASTLANIRIVVPNADVIALTSNPADTTARHGIPAFSVYGEAAPSVEPAAPAADAPGARDRLKQALARVPSLYRALRAGRDGLSRLGRIARELPNTWTSWQQLRGVRLLLVAGSGQVNDYYGGPWGYPYRLLKWSVLTRLRGGHVAFVSVGAGPITSPLSRWMCGAALSLAAYRSFRDAPSLALAVELGVSDGNRLAPDLAFGLPAIARATRAPTGGDIRTVAIGPLPFQSGGYWHESDAGGYETYVRDMAAFATWLTQRGVAVRFVPTQFAVDPGVIQDIVAVMRGQSTAEPAGVSVALPRTVDELLAALADVDAVVATRFHGILLSLALSKPTMGIAYHSKTPALMAAFGQERFAVPIETLELPVLTAAFERLMAESGPGRATMLQRREELRLALAREFSDLARLVEVRPHAAGEPDTVTP